MSQALLEVAPDAAERDVEAAAGEAAGEAAPRAAPGPGPPSQKGPPCEGEGDPKLAAASNPAFLVRQVATALRRREGREGELPAVAPAAELHEMEAEGHVFAATPAAELPDGRAEDEAVASAPSAKLPRSTDAGLGFAAPKAQRTDMPIHSTSSDGRERALSDVDLGSAVSDIGSARSSPPSAGSASARNDSSSSRVAGPPSEGPTPTGRRALQFPPPFAPPQVPTPRVASAPPPDPRLLQALDRLGLTEPQLHGRGIVEMTHTELVAERERVRQESEHFDDEFHARAGRQPRSADKEPVRPLY